MAPPSTLTAPQELFINGEYSPSGSSSTFPVVNPMTGATIYQAAAASVADYERAIQTAHAAFASWSKTSPSARRLILLRAADIMDTYIAPNSPSHAAEILSAEVRTKEAGNMPLSL
jgi:acyl-CoA reductase-like NAD-dependent aldehyde dehydrogenase